MVEAMRSWVRGFLGYRSLPYAFAAHVIVLYFLVSRERAAGVRLLWMRRHAGPGLWFKFKNLLFPIYVRPGTADIDSVIDNIIREEYGQLPTDFAPRVIFDVGAYIGDTTSYFLSRFGGARVIAIEPSCESYDIALNNLSRYDGRVSVIKRALWDSVGSAQFGGRETGASIVAEGSLVLTTTIPVLMREFGIEAIDLLKMDIEGAELTVLRSGVNGWLKVVKILLLETHGKEIEDVALPLLRKEGFHIHRHRNVWYCINERIS